MITHVNVRVRRHIFRFTVCRTTRSTFSPSKNNQEFWW